MYIQRVEKVVTLSSFDAPQVEDIRRSSRK